MKLIKKYLDNSIIKNSLVLVAGSAIANIMLIVFQLFLRRMYTPEEFGTLGLYLSITGILIVISTLRYEFSVVLPKDESTANNLVAGGLIISTLISFIFFIIILFFKNTIVELVNFPQQYSYWLYFVPLSVISYSIYQFFNFWLTRKSKYIAISGNKVVRRLSEGGTQFGLKYCAPNFGLVVGEVIGNVANVIAGWIQVKNAGFTFKSVSFNKIKSSLKQYSDFPKFQVLPMLLNTISMMLPYFFLSIFYGPDSTGQFDLTRQVLVVPIGFITASLSQVLLKELSDKIKNRTPILSGIYKTALALSILISPFLIILLLFGDSIFAFLFSDTWTQAGEFSSILVWAFSMQFIVSPLWTVFTALEKLKPLAIWQVCCFFSIGLLFLFSYLPINTFLLLYTIITIALFLICFLMIIYYARKYDTSLKKAN